MKKYILLCIAALACFCACSEQDVEKFDLSKHYLYVYPKQGLDKDSTFMTFKHYVDITEREITFPVHLLGQMLEKDATYRLEIVDDETTALESDYRVDLEQTFHAGLWVDSVRITVLKTPHLQTDNVCVTLRLVPNETFGVADNMADLGDVNPGLVAASSVKMTVAFNDKISKPDWWTEDVEKRFLGEYSDIKYERFIEATDGEGADLSDKSETERRILLKQFKDKLDSVQPGDPDYDHWCEANGEKIQIPYQGN